MDNAAQTDTPRTATVIQLRAHQAAAAAPAAPAAPASPLLERIERAQAAYQDALSAHDELAAKHAAAIKPLRELRDQRAREAHRTFMNVRADLHEMARADRDNPLLVSLRATVKRAPKGKCCDWAVRHFCVCADSYECPLHGVTCGGAH